MRIFWLVLICLVLLGCGERGDGGISAEIIPSPVPTRLQPTTTPTIEAKATERPTKTSAATATTTPIATPSPTLNEPKKTPAATASPLPELTSTSQHPTPTPIVIEASISGESYDQTGLYPDWLWQPDSQVLMVEFQHIFKGWRSEDFPLSFLNVSEQEYFIAEVQENVSRGRWLQTDGEWLLESWITDSIVEPLGRWANIVPVAIQHINFETNQKTELPLDYYGLGRVVASPDDEFLVRRITNSESNAITLTLETKDMQSVSVLDDPFNTSSTYEQIEWSWNGEFVAVTRHSEYEGEIRPILTIYNRNGSIVKSFTDIDGAKWSPTTNNEMLISKQSDYEASSVCILDIFTRDTRCLDKHLGRLQEDGQSSFNYEWMPDGTSVSYVVWIDGELEGGLCKVEIGSEVSTCVVKHIDISLSLPDEARLGWGDTLPRAIIKKYSWSPDGNHIAMITTPFLFSDSAEGTSLFTVSLEREKILYWGYASDFLGWRK